MISVPAFAGRKRKSSASLAILPTAAASAAVAVVVAHRSPHLTPFTATKNRSEQHTLLISPVDA
jgi:hypothetical protein